MASGFSTSFAKLSPTAESYSWTLQLCGLINLSGAPSPPHSSELTNLAEHSILEYFQIGLTVS